MKKQRKSIVAATFLKKGTVIKISDLNYKVPNEGLLPYQVDLVLGKTLKCDLEEDDYITLDSLL